MQLRATLDRFEGHKGVILFDDEEVLGTLAGQELVLPRRHLPIGCKEGDVVIVELMTDQQATETKERIARKVLEEILNGQ